MTNNSESKQVLIACEFSGVVRDAFRTLGFNAFSCDFEKSDSPYHIRDDVRHHLNRGWDLMIAHPPCTFLCNSGVRWLFEPGHESRRNEMENAVMFIKELWKARIKRICIENPIPHRYAVNEMEQWGIPKYSQLIQPWQFGHGETKATCLWLKNLPKLIPTRIVKGRKARIHRMPPSKERGKLRSISYKGIARAMAEQWGCLL